MYRHSALTCVNAGILKLKSPDEKVEPAPNNRQHVNCFSLYQEVNPETYGMIRRNHESIFILKASGLANTPILIKRIQDRDSPDKAERTDTLFSLSKKKICHYIPVERALKR